MHIGATSINRGTLYIAMSSIGPKIPTHLLAASLSTSLPLSGDERRHVTESSSAPIGPVLPPDPQAQPSAFIVQASPVEEEDEDEDDYAPMLPPDLAALRDGGAVPNSAPKRAVGPAMPPTYVQHFDEDGGGDDDDDDDVGPRPLPAGLNMQKKDAVAEFMEREERRRKAVEVCTIRTLTATAT
jgi:cytochrome c1